ncbi:MAG: nascent polypeptide-associated complex protein [Candidatus Woesearchaeota archaeon]|nr:nascent polypeptide-associated complex protein [Candidatus Woesearchaeota archaeon]
MMPNINPRMMRQAMKRMGIQQREIDASEVIIRCSDKDIIVTNPQVSKVNMMGQETFQISGNIQEREKQVSAEISKDDIKMVAEQAEVSEKEAEEALKEAEGDIAAAILKLKG